ncbi:MAG: DUF3800 domain-containing protein [Deltaproteobacteria bacterium]|nr:DUF3800 domain-containing protein [Deltaproteobacteria bacterium]
MPSKWDQFDHRDARTLRPHVHDEQAQLEQILRDYAQGLESNKDFDLLSQSAAQEHVNYDFSAGKMSLTFSTSHETAGIQVADLVAAICTRRLNSIIEGARNDDLLEEARMLGRTPRPGLGLNLVTTFARVDQFYGLRSD